MGAWLFRVPDSAEDQSDGFIGIVSAETMTELFEELEQHGNPYEIEIKPLDLGSIGFIPINLIEDNQEEDLRAAAEFTLHASHKLEATAMDSEGWVCVFEEEEE